MRTLQQHISEVLRINKNSRNFEKIKVSDIVELQNIINKKCSDMSDGYLDLSDIDVSKIDSFDCLFSHKIYRRKDIRVIDCTDWDTSYAVSMRQMFEDCVRLEDIIGIENWNIGGVNDFYYMFADTPNLDLTDKVNNSNNWKINATKCNVKMMWYKTKTNYDNYIYTPF